MLHIVDLMFKDFSKLIFEVKDVVTDARTIIRFVYNHLAILQLLKKFNNDKKIIRLGATRFATNFLTLQSILENKEALRKMVVDNEWGSGSKIVRLSRSTRGVEFENVILRQSFWATCSKVIAISEPLVRTLRMVDSDKKPPMGYLYEAMRISIKN